MSVDSVGVGAHASDPDALQSGAGLSGEAPPERLGLRERKKRATRQALHSQALRLVAARGFDDVTIEDIAAAADVSPRTFFNYFGSKEDVIVNPDPDRIERLRSLLDQHPGDEPPMAVIEAVLLAQLDEVTTRREEWLLRLKLVREIPALTPRHLAAFDAMERVFVEHVARRTGREVTDLQPLLVAAASMAAMRAAISLWSVGDGHHSLPELVREAFAALRAGLG
jgi:AcrR family transcriptional regulator